MVNYRLTGNFPAEEIFGSKENTEKILKGMNICKTIGVQLGAEYDPPYIWNKNFPESWCGIISKAVINNLMKDKNWKPSPLFIAGLRKELSDAEV